MERESAIPVGEWGIAGKPPLLNMTKYIFQTLYKSVGLYYTLISNLYKGQTQCPYA